MVLAGQRARRRSRFRHGTLPQGLPAADGGEPRQSGADRRDAGARAGRRGEPSPRASGCISPPPTPGTSGSLDEFVPDLAADPRRRSDRPAGIPHLRHDLVPPRPDAVDPGTGRPCHAALVGRSARLRLCPDHLGVRARGGRRHQGRGTRGRCGAGTRPDQLLRAPRQGARAWTPTAARARAASGSAAQVAQLVAGQQPDPSPVVASHADAARPRRARRRAGELRRRTSATSTTR